MPKSLNFQFSKLCGKSFTGGDLAFTPDGNSLICPVSNRVSVFDLVNHKSFTMIPENRRNIKASAMSPNGSTYVSVDDEGRALILNFHKRVSIGHFNFKGKVNCLSFSPNGKYLAVGVGKILCVYYAPSLLREFIILNMHRKFTGAYDDIITIAWSSDSEFVAFGGRDLAIRIYSLNALEGYDVKVLMGHKRVIRGLCFGNDEDFFSVSEDGALFHWNLSFDREAKQFSANLLTRHYLEIQHGVEHLSRVTCVAFHRGKSGILGVIGFNSGVFSIYELPTFTSIHSLSISSEEITSVAINKSGDWLAFGCPKLGQVLVWEWKSETYVLKQQGHHFDMNCVDFSRDGQIMATGGDDGKIKLWNSDTGYCFVTFNEHAAPITDICFNRSNIVLSSSRDGTVRAFDLTRYRNFRTFTPPMEEPVQLTCVTSDPSGDIVCAGSLDPFNIYVWSLRTAKILEVLSGHEGPISQLAFSAQKNLLVSSSWDKTVRIWDVFSTKAANEVLSHGSDVVCLAISPDGSQVCSATLDGQLYFWDISDGKLLGIIEGKKDIIGGRKKEDPRTALNSTQGNHFTTVRYSPDGSIVLAGGNSKFVCMYEVSERILLKKFQISHNQSLDGILDKLNSKEITEAGPKSSIDDDVEEKYVDLKTILEEKNSLPGANIGNLSSRKVLPAIRSKDLAFAPSGDTWAVASTEGLLLYSLSREALFDPFDLDMDITPETIKETFLNGEFSRALLMSLRLNEKNLIELIVEHIPPSELSLVVRSIPPQALKRVLDLLADLMENSSFLEFYLLWLQTILVVHGNHIKKNSQLFNSSLRAIQKRVSSQYASISHLCHRNQYQLEYLSSFARHKMEPLQENYPLKRVTRE